MRKVQQNIILFLITFISFSSIVSAESFETYIAHDENSPIQELSISESIIYVTINSTSTEVLATNLLFANFTDNTIGMVNPNSTSESIAQEQIDLGIDFNTIREQLNLGENPNVNTVINQIQTNAAGIYPLIYPQGQLVFMVSQAEFVEDEASVRVKLFGDTLLNLDRPDNQTLIYQGYELILE